MKRSSPAAGKVCLVETEAFPASDGAVASPPQCDGESLGQPIPVPCRLYGQMQRLCPLNEVYCGHHASAADTNALLGCSEHREAEASSVTE